MTKLELYDLTQVYWKEIAKKCNRAVVFIDNAAAECLHWAGGVELLNTCIQIREFSSFEAAPKHDKKAVFIVANPALKRTQQILKDITKNSSLEYCIIITWCQPNVLSVWNHPTRDFNVDDKSGLHWLEDSLLDWMGNSNYTAEVFYYPIFTCSPCRYTFYTPTYSRLYPLLSPDVTKCTALWKLLNPGQQTQIQPGQIPEQLCPILPGELRNAIRQLVANLHSLLGSLQLKEDIWSIGPYARCVADELEAWMPAKNRRRSAQTSAAGGGGVSLILVDRTLDVAGAAMSGCGGGRESVLGRMLEAHDKLESHSLDVKVDLSSLVGVSCPEMFVPSSLASPGRQDEGVEAAELTALFFDSEKSILSSLHDSLANGATPKSKDASGGGHAKLAAAATVAGLANDLKGYEGNLEAIMGNLASVTRAQALVNASDSQDIVKRKRLQSLVTQFGPQLNASSEGVLEELTSLVLSRADSRLTLVDILQLLVYVYSASHTDEKFRKDEEERLKSVLGEAILMEGNKGTLHPLLQSITRKVSDVDEMNELVALNVVNHIWSRLDSLLITRASLNRYSSLLDEDGNYYGFLRQLLDDIYHKDRKEVVDLHHHSGGLGAMLRTGLGWLGAAGSKQHPRENPWIILFVLGGVTPYEIKHLQEIVEGTDSKLTVAGTGIFTPLDSLHLLFNNNPLLIDI